MTPHTDTSRITWLDAMRGFTMILVVMYHVAHISFGMTDKYSSCQPFLVLFRMPLFFFVSGFLAYKAGMDWTGSLLRSLSWKKVKVQVLPAAVFLCVFTAMRKGSFVDMLWGSLQSATKSGYWFTWVLLHIFLAYYAVCYLSRRLGISSSPWKKGLLMAFCLLIAVVLHALSYMPPVMKELSSGFRDFLNWSSLIQTVHYAQYFIFGNIVRRYWHQVQKLMDTRWFFIAVLLVAYFAASDALVWHKLKFMWRNLPLTLSAYALLLLVVMFFRHYKEWFGSDTVVGRTLQYIGVRTLDIYLLHFLFLPSLPMVGDWFDHHRRNFVLDFSASLLVALLVIAFCLLVSSLLRINPVLSEYLFGRKKR